MKRNRKRLLSGLLALVMAFNAVPLSGLEAGAYPTSKIACPHHLEHTEDCGYVEAEGGNPCSHVHDEDCYVYEERCIHEHTQECYEEGDGAEKATSSEADKDESLECGHECGEDTGCIKRVPDCSHEHDGDCGYEKGEAGAPCRYQCEICSQLDEEEIWEEAPSWLFNPEEWEEPRLADMEFVHKAYGRPWDAASPSEIEDIRRMSRMSMNLDIEEKEELKLEEDITVYTIVYINGEPYIGGDVEAMVGDNFSYLFTWSPRIDNEETYEPIKEGDWFETTVFKVPNLNLPRNMGQSLVINGIKTGEWTATYNPDTGEMKYKVVFNRYIQFFDMDTILAMLQGSGKFSGTTDEGGKPIEVQGDIGTITITPRPELPPVPDEGGKGWQPSKPPVFNNRPWAFGKGVKWDSHGNASSVPQIDWRIVFFDKLQKLQEEFLETGEAPEPMTGYCIVEDTLDENHVFYNPSGEGRFGDAPFHLELPVLVPGTDAVLNGSAGSYGVTGSYDGPGEIIPYIPGDSGCFEEIVCDGQTMESIKKAQIMVRNTPLTWTVTTHPETGQQTLLINLGILGGTDPEKSLTWDMGEGGKTKGWWPKQGLDDLIKDCDEKIEAIITGADSPFTLLGNRHAALGNTLKRAMELEGNQDDGKQWEETLEQWEQNWDQWIETQKVGPLFPLEDENGNLYVPLPYDGNMLDKIGEMKADSKGTPMSSVRAYKDFRASYDNLRDDQKLYLDNRTSYGEGWRMAKERYETAREFYDKSPVFGFTIKCRTKAINTSMSSYKNTVKIEIGDQTWTAEDEHEVQFAAGVIGNYSLGTVVVQKADKLYDDGEDVVDQIHRVEDENNGLVGAKFQVYCEKATESDAELAYFLGKDASENEDSYRYTHSGEGHAEHEGITGEIMELEVNDDGKLILTGMTPLHPHFLVETKAPDGYYLDTTPLKLTSKADDITYYLRPNIARSVLLEKVDSYSGLPVEGAEFSLYDQEGKAKTFSRKTVNGHTAYWYDPSGGITGLKTNAEGILCLHGLPECTGWLLKEVKAAPGYEAIGQSAPQYTITLEESLPADQSGMDKIGHILLTKDQKLENMPRTASLFLTKVNGNNTQETLAEAGFALFRFKGTEAEWEEDPDKESMWIPVTPNENKNGKQYFTTDNEVEDLRFPELSGSFRELPALMTKEEGSVKIENIPVGHYSIAEVKAPEGYVRDYHSFYFDVNGETADAPLKLYDGLGEGRKEVPDNQIWNYKKKAQLALVKYDGANEPPEIKGEAYQDGWKYDGAEIEKGKGLSGAVYKLFMRIGASGGQTNPHPDELNTEAIQGIWDGVYDYCLAVGETDENGILELKNMKDKNGQLSFADGINMEQYYLIEVKAPDGYRLNQSPILFPLTVDTAPSEPSDSERLLTPGLVKLAANYQYDYGIRLQKSDRMDSSKALAGAVFTIQEKGSDQLLMMKKTALGYRITGDSSEGEPGMTTGADGRVTVYGLKPGGEYVITETMPPRGYELLEKPVEVKAPTSLTDGAEDGNLLLTEVNVTNGRKKGVMMLHKEDEETRKALAGAQFQLYHSVFTPILPSDPDYDPNYPEGTRTEIKPVGEPKITDADGNVTFDDLEWDDFYYVQEVKAPEGYLLDETKLSFVIDENSFDRSGNPIPVRFPHVTNAKGTLGEVTLYKVDRDDPNKKLEDAHFFLSKKVIDYNGQEHWVGYGKGIYITDEKGEIHFLLPPGEYSLIEMKAPDGYLLPEDMDEEYHFTIEDRQDGIGPEPISITVENQKGSAGVCLQKRVSVNGVILPDVPVEGAVFEFYQGSEDRLLHFIPAGGVYEYTENAEAPGAVSRISTDENGEIMLTFPQSFIPNPDDILELVEKQILYKEISAPGNLVVDGKLTPVSPLIEDAWIPEDVGNELKDQGGSNSCRIMVDKKDGNTGQPLAGAKFQLYTVLEMGDLVLEEPVGKPKTTDKNGRAVFDGLAPGTVYHITEIEAPAGYVKDETRYRIEIGADDFDEDFNFIPITLNVENQKERGTVALRKVDLENGTALPGAEFELFAQNPTDPFEWNHYGSRRYVTDSEGTISLELPIGNYYWIERSAPLGYMLGEAEAIHFTIDQDGAEIQLGDIENQADPRDRGAVRVLKTAEEDPSRLLSGAKFRLYYKGVDGSYHQYHTRNYVTDEKGSFEIANLPLGSYAVREIEAPDGYQLPAGNALFIFDVTEKDQVVELEIENRRIGTDPDEPDNPDEPDKPDNPGGGHGGGSSGGGSRPGGGSHQDQHTGPGVTPEISTPLPGETAMLPLQPASPAGQPGMEMPEAGLPKTGEESGRGLSWLMLLWGALAVLLYGGWSWRRERKYKK